MTIENLEAFNDETDRIYAIKTNQVIRLLFPRYESSGHIPMEEVNTVYQSLVILCGLNWCAVIQGARNQRA